MKPFPTEKAYIKYWIDHDKTVHEAKAEYKRDKKLFEMLLSMGEFLASKGWIPPDDENKS